MNKITIVYCIDSLTSAGGTERVTTTKVNWLAKDSIFNVYIITLKEDQEPYFKLSDKVNHITINIRSNSISKYKQELEKNLKIIAPDIIVCVAGLALTIIPKLNIDSKKIIEFHYTKNFLVNFVNGMHYVRFRWLHLQKMRWLQWRLARISSKYDYIVGLTKRDVELWGNPQNMLFIYNPLSFRSDKISSCDNHSIIAVGSFTPVKGMDQLIVAFGQVARKYPTWKLDLYGSGQDKLWLIQLIQKYNISHQVTLHEPCNNIKDKLLSSSIYAFPSRSDGFGLVIIEAMECGLPTIAMDCECGPREILSAGTGILVPNKDIDSFAQALDILMSNAPLRKEMGCNAKQRVSRFYPENIMPQWISFFQKILNRV